jgi:hypothetical protein
MIVLFFLLFLIGGIYQLFTGHFTDAALLLGFSAVLIFFARWVVREKEQAVEFLKWIQSKQEDLKKGWAFYRGQKITLKTEVTQYQGCISFVIMTSRFRSRYMVVGQSNAGTWLIFSGLTFFCGWWGLPWGFIFTPQALYRNLRGGYHQPVSALLANIDAEIDKLTNTKKKKLSTILSEAKAEARA